MYLSKGGQEGRLWKRLVCRRRCDNLSNTLPEYDEPETQPWGAAVQTAGEDDHGIRGRAEVSGFH